MKWQQVLKKATKPLKLSSVHKLTVFPLFESLRLFTFLLGNRCTGMKLSKHTVLGSQGVLAVSHVGVVDWPETEPLLSGSSKLIRIFHEVQQLKQRQSKKGPVLVHCLWVGYISIALLSSLVFVNFIFLIIVLVVVIWHYQQDRPRWYLITILILRELSIMSLMCRNVSAYRFCYTFSVSITIYLYQTWELTNRSGRRWQPLNCNITHESYFVCFPEMERQEVVCSVPCARY